jgi:hypothetical protein
MQGFRLPMVLTGMGKNSNLNSARRGRERTRDQFADGPKIPAISK